MAGHSRWLTKIYRLMIAVLAVTVLTGCEFPDLIGNMSGILSTVASNPQQPALNPAQGAADTSLTSAWAPLPPDQESVSGKVMICHKTDPLNQASSMVLPRSALSVHLGHGDTLGACH